MNTSAEERALIADVNRYENAWLKSDITLLEQMLDPGFTYTSPTGQIFTKEQDLANLRSGALKYKSLTLNSVSPRIYGDVAVVLSETSVSGEVQGKAFTGKFRGTGCWQRRAGRWIILAFHASEIQG